MKTYTAGDILEKATHHPETEVLQDSSFGDDFDNFTHDNPVQYPPCACGSTPGPWTPKAAN